MRTREEIFASLRQHLEEMFEVPADAITPEATLYEDLDLDSLDAVDLIVKLQEITGRKIPPADFKTVRTVGDLIERLARLGPAPVDQQIIAYTRKVTALWFGFLLGNGTVSAWTVIGASAEVWLLYNGCIAYLAMGLLFLAELGVRLVVVRRRRP